ncbi:MAG TPA: hypothetical protein VGN90_00745 [Pyrinomonadaceae bacterium]|jgi:hypothetical protein|nr:hypothetical protein [Pyrinomonadaceae bacterium]
MSILLWRAIIIRRSSPDVLKLYAVPGDQNRRDHKRNAIALENRGKSRNDVVKSSFAGNGTLVAKDKSEQEG